MEAVYQQEGESNLDYVTRVHLPVAKVELALRGRYWPNPAWGRDPDVIQTLKEELERHFNDDFEEQDSSDQACSEVIIDIGAPFPYNEFVLYISNQRNKISKIGKVRKSELENGKKFEDLMK